MISDYLERLEDALGFDRALARRVRVEIEDHLREAAAAHLSSDRRNAEECAIAACGDPRVLAEEFAIIAMTKRTRKLGVGVFLAIAGILIAMKARVAWYAPVHCTVSDDMRPVAAFIGSIDAGGFWTSFLIGIAAAVYLGHGRTPAPLVRMRRFRLLCAAATAALTISVISDGILTSIRLATAAASASYLLVLSILFEVSCTVILATMIRDLARREAFTAALQVGPTRFAPGEGIAGSRRNPLR